MKLSISDVIDKHKNKKCIIIGHGPSLNDHVENIKRYKENGYIIIGCNNWNEFYSDSPPNYWVNANNIDSSSNMMSLINNYKIPWIYADSVDLTDQGWIDAHFQVDYLPYDQRHFDGKKCYSCNECKYRNPQRLTIQEELKKYTNYNKIYSPGHTVVLHCLAFSILMGCSEIYFIGLDFDYKLGYANNLTGRRPQKSESLNYFDHNVYGGDILNDIKIIRDSAKNINVDMYNMNNKSSWGIIEYREIG